MDEESSFWMSMEEIMAESSSSTSNSEQVAGSSRERLIIHANWTDRVNLVLPKEMDRYLKGVVSKKNRLSLVRLLVDRMFEVELFPKKKEVELIAQRVVSQYPVLSDKDGTCLLGSGFSSLAHQLLNRIDTLHRIRTLTSKRKIPNMALIGSKKSKHGCINWQPQGLDEGESNKSQEEKRKELISMYNDGISNDRTLALQEKTYFSQRFAINQGTKVLELMETWPTLFTFDGAMAHAKKLTGENFWRNIIDAYESKGNSWINFIKSLDTEKTNIVMAEMEELMFQYKRNKDVFYVGLFMLVNTMMGESDGSLLVEEAAYNTSIQEGQFVIENPCIIYSGLSALRCAKFRVALEGKLLRGEVNFPAALSMIFSFYFSLNKLYPTEDSATLDLFQRSFLGINPPNGSKMRGNGHSKGVHAKVSTFFQKFAAYTAAVESLDGFRTQNTNQKSESSRVEPKETSKSSIPFDVQQRNSCKRNWTDKFQLVLPDEILGLIRGPELLPWKQLEFTRHVMDMVYALDTHPRRRDLKIMAKGLVTMYPILIENEELKDIASAGEKLTQQLFNKHDNCNRKRKLEDILLLPQVPKKTNLAICGCEYCDPYFLGEDETPQEEKRLQMLALFQEGKENSHIIDLQKQTYLYQRRDINSESITRGLIEKWPSLFTYVGAMTHAEQLTGINFGENMVDAFKKKSEAFYDYIRRLENEKVAQVLLDIEAAKERTGREATLEVGLLILINTVLEETTKNLFAQGHGVTCDLTMNRWLPVTPCIVYHGSDPLVSEKFMVATDRYLLSGEMGFPQALAMVFALQFNLNKLYAQDAGATLDFFQRFFIGINHSTGAKTGDNYPFDGIHPDVTVFYRKFQLHMLSVHGAANPSLECIDQETVDVCLDAETLQNTTCQKHWTDRIELKFPDEMKRNLKAHVLEPTMRKAFIRLVMDQVMTLQSNPKQSELKIIAGRLVKMFPNLTDKDGDTVIGSGFDSLTTQLTCRYDNAVKQQNRLKASTGLTGTPKRGKWDDYGCINWGPLRMGPDENENTQEEKRKKLISVFNEGTDSKRMVALQEATYFTQRKEINNGAPVSDLMDRWPTLFSFVGAIAHAKQLTGKNFWLNMRDAYEKKVNSMLDFMKSINQDRTRLILLDIEDAQASCGGDDVLYIGVFILVNDILGDSTEKLFINEDAVYSETAEEKKEIPINPSIMFRGPSVLKAKKFKVATDGFVLSGEMTFTAALAMVFSLYFNLNKLYAADVGATMDLFQRSFIGINPSSGSKSGGQHRYDGIHGKVGSFYQKYSAFMDRVDGRQISFSKSDGDEEVDEPKHKLRAKLPPQIVHPPNWTNNFKFSISSLMEKKLSANFINIIDRRELVRFVVDKAVQVERHPRLKDFRIIAGKLVRMYPALADRDGDVIIGSGFDSLVTQMANRYDNLQRRKGGVGHSTTYTENDTWATPSPQLNRSTSRRKKVESYGCINWAPEELELGEDEESQEKKRIELLSIAKEAKDLSRMLLLQEQTYYSQRREINSGKPVNVLMERWPTLFAFDGAVAHAKQLTGENFWLNITVAYETKSKSLYEFIRHLKNERNRQTIKEIEEVRKRKGSDDILFVGLFLLINETLGESADNLFIHEDVIAKGAAENTQAFQKPCIVYSGSSPLMTEKFWVAIDGLLLGGLHTFPAALALMFCMYFTLNRIYVGTGSATMDLFQRSFVGINPSTGTKCGSLRRYDGVHGKVGTFFQKYSSYLASAAKKKRKRSAKREYSTSEEDEEESDSEYEALIKNEPDTSYETEEEDEVVEEEEEVEEEGEAERGTIGRRTRSKRRAANAGAIGVRPGKWTWQEKVDLSMPQDVEEQLQSPDFSLSDRFEFIRILSDKVMAVETKPKVGDVRLLAEKLVSMYPVLSDMDGDGTGHAKLTSQLLSRFDNLRRRKVKPFAESKPKANPRKRSVKRERSTSGEEDELETDPEYEAGIKIEPNTSCETEEEEVAEGGRLRRRTRSKRRAAAQKRRRRSKRRAEGVDVKDKWTWQEKVDLSMPQDVEDQLQGPALSIPDRQDVIRIVADKVMAVEPKPKTGAIRLLAEKLVSMYPVLSDMDGVGTGHAKLTTQLFNRFDNLRRRNCKPLAEIRPTRTKPRNRSGKRGRLTSEEVEMETDPEYEGVIMIEPNASSGTEEEEEEAEGGRLGRRTRSKRRAANAGAVARKGRRRSERGAEGVGVEDKWTWQEQVDLSMPQDVEDQLQGPALSIPERQDVIRIVADKVMAVEPKPKTGAIRLLAEKLVSMYPVLSDMDGVGTGHAKLTTQLFNRFDNLRRRNCKPLAESRPTRTKPRNRSGKRDRLTSEEVEMETDPEYEGVIMIEPNASYGTEEEEEEAEGGRLGRRTRSKRRAANAGAVARKGRRRSERGAEGVGLRPGKWTWQEQVDLSMPMDVEEQLLGPVMSISDRHEVVRIVADKVMAVEPKAKMGDVRLLAEKLVSMYPVLSDMDGLGTGHEKLTTQLINRFDNLRRRNCRPFSESRPSAKPRKATPKKPRMDDYGYINADPSELEAGENEETQEQKRKQLLTMCHGGNDCKEMIVIQEQTYFSQRKEINAGTPVCTIMERWPTLFTFDGAIAHAMQLTGVNFWLSVTDAYESRANTMFDFIKSLKNERTKEIVSEIEEERARTGSEETIYAGLFLLVNEIMGDSTKSVLVQRESISSDFHVDRKIPVTPCILYEGSSPLKAEKFAFATESYIHCSEIAFPAALALLFAVFFNLDREYPSDASGTMDFFQGAFLGINPWNGNSDDCNGTHDKVANFYQNYCAFMSDQGESELLTWDGGYGILSPQTDTSGGERQGRCWVDSFQLILPDRIKDYLVKPVMAYWMRLEFVRFVIKEVMKTVLRPKMKELRLLASNLVTMYPVLTDPDGQGFITLANQFINRYDNQHRTWLKLKPEEESLNEDEMGSSSYTEWPVDVPERQKEEEGEEKSEKELLSMLKEEIESDDLETVRDESNNSQDIDFNP